MSGIVLDASVLIKLYINEEGSRRAASAVKKAETLIAPDLLWSEVGNILWKYVRRDALDADTGEAILQDMLQMPIVAMSSSDLLPQAFEIATKYDRTVYDSLYLAAAVRAGVVMLTADERLAKALAGSPMDPFVRGL
ncbi:MAG: type II toxin-antitoxin system VapC family toxin [Phycisphaeraceae bacterium]